MSPGSPKNDLADAAPAAQDVVAHLEQAEEAVLAREREWEKRVADLDHALRSTRETNRELGRHLESVTGELDEKRRESDFQKRRADRLAQAARELHNALFSGNIYEMILRACLTISGASRGLYITWRKAQDAPGVRAAVDVDGYPGRQPSAFLVAACARVIETRDTLVCSEEEAADLPTPPDSERFRNWAVVPALLQRDFDGVVVVADKQEGEFNEVDLEAMLSVGNQAAVALENAHLHRELEQAYLTTISTLADAVEAKDSYTHGHCEMASRHARMTAERLGLSDHDRAVICYAALLHDVGKIGVSDGVLNKPGPLLPEELELVRAHVRVGHDLIRNVPALEEVATAVLHHHEWYDGSGYPDGLKGTGIPMAARVVAVVDAFGAMITRRSYKEAYPESYAREELQRFAGKQFDPQVVSAFLEVLDIPSEEQANEPYGGELSLLPALAHLRDAHVALPQARG